MRIADIDLAAARHNLHRMREITGAPAIIAVVKANAYGHGALPLARAFSAAGADALAVADIDEALQLRDQGVTARLMAWLHDPTADFAAALTHDVELAVSSTGQLEAIVDAGRRVQRTARIHLKVETGLNRNGARRVDWPHLVRAVSDQQRTRAVQVVGVFSHLANVSVAGNRQQAVRLRAAVDDVRAAGIDPGLVHLAASEGALTDPEVRLDGVRLGIALYGLSPTGDPASNWGLKPVMTLRSRVALVSDIAAGEGVSYGHDWIADAPTRVALVPIGYADGLPRAASGWAEVAINGVRFPVRGRIAMDQIVVDVSDAAVFEGDDVVLWGDPATGAPTADDWAAWAGTIGYELVTKIGRRVSYRFIREHE